MNSRYTPEMDAWLAERYPAAPNRELAEEFEEAFGQPITVCQLSCWANSRGVRKPRKVEWDAEKEDFLRGFVPGHTEDEIREAFLARFGIELTESQIGNAKTRLGVRSGTTGGRFEKGHVSHNKGRSWDEQGIPPEKRERMLSTCFKAGSEPVNGQRIPIGSERVGKDGYIQVKVRTRSPVPCANKCWRPKHHLVWEEANGQEVPPKTMIVFADGNKRNFDPGNLVAVPRRLWAVIARQKIAYADREGLETAMALAELKSRIRDRRCRERPCRRCGATFAPRHPNQRTCDACLEARRGA